MVLVDVRLVVTVEVNEVVGVVVKVDVPLVDKLLQFSNTLG